MKSVLKIVLLLCLTLTFVGCPSDDAPAPIPLRDEATVYQEDIDKIEDFLLSHYVTVDADYNTTFTQIPAGGLQIPIKNMPELQSKDVEVKDITYKLYYLKLREGVGESTTRLDSSFVAYKGNTVTKTSVGGVDTYTQEVFDYAPTPVWFGLESVVRGWGEIIPNFKTGTYTTNANGTVTYEDFGAGVMFIPSGLGYFNIPTGSIAAYTPLIFNFKLYNQRAKDHDRDGILSKYEYGPDLYEPAIDTDGDGTADYLDQDDDGDGFLTRFEIRFPVVTGTPPNEITTYYNYPYEGAATDDPATPYDDRRGIPRKFTGPIITPSTMPSPLESDFIDPTRLRRHLDKTSKPPYTN